MILLFFVLLHAYLYAAKSLSNEELIDELGKIRQIVKFLESNMEEQGKAIKTQEKQIEVLRNIVTVQNIELKTLKREMDDLRNQGTKETENNVIKGETRGTNGMKELLEATEYSSGKGRNLRKGRITPRQESQGPVAFYAYMSGAMQNVGGHHQLAFDVVKTNVGNAFHPSTGVFIVPESGLYVFTWSYRIANSGYHSIEVAVNGITAGVTHTHVQSNDQDQTSATIVIHVNKGDDVFLRTGSALNSGNIFSDKYGYSYFAGWKIN